MKGVNNVKYVEWVEGKPSLFNEIYKMRQYPFIADYGSENIDLLYKMKYGDREVAKNIEKLTIQELARILVAAFGESWNNLYVLIRNMELGVDSKTVIDETVTDDTTRVSTSNQTNKVSAFNDDDLATNNSDEDTVNDDIKKESKKMTNHTVYNMNAIKSQIELMNDHFIDNVLKDVSRIVSLSIY